MLRLLNSQLLRVSLEPKIRRSIPQSVDSHRMTTKINVSQKIERITYKSTSHPMTCGNKVEAKPSISSHYKK